MNSNFSKSKNKINHHNISAQNIPTTSKHSNFNMRLIFISFLFSTAIPASSSVPQPDLTQLFSGIANCDLHIIRNKEQPSDISFTLFLPTIFGLWPRNWSSFLQDISQFRPPPCRIFYTDDRFSITNGSSEILNSYAFNTMGGFMRLNSRENIFFIAYLTNTEDPEIPWQIDY